MPIITLLTDFGTADGYVAEMKGVLITEIPNATLVDISHDVPAHDVDAGRLALARYWRRFPRGTVHLAVVDPGVGSERSILVAESGGHVFSTAGDSFAMAYDSARERIVLFGGRTDRSGDLNDTWEWDGRTWTRVGG